MKRKVCSLRLAAPTPAALAKLAKLTMLALLGILAARPAVAGNGHFLHGVGAVNDAMGGAGVALPHDPLGALNLNPALLTELDGSGLGFAAAYPKAGTAGAR